ncbi:MAG: aldo/keto reductase [Clostridiales bacterium]|nr:aldo/keto reductase [Clostridiales bacterium]
MKTRFLRDLKVSAIGYGCMGLSHGYGAVPERGESIRLIRKAFDYGCTFFDTAEGYGAGDNERLVGEAVKPFRSQIVLATKLRLNKRDGDTAAVIRGHLEASLKRLGTDYVDLYYQHRIEDDDKVEEVAAVMGELIKEGKIRGWGQSQATEDQVRRANAVTPLSAVQSEFSMMERMFEKDVIPACEELGIGFVPFSPLASGFLSGKYAKEQIYTGDDVRRVITRFAPENVERNQPLLDLLQSMAQEKNATPAQISLAWMLHKKEFIVPIPGMRKMERMEENFGASDVTLTRQEYENLEKSLEGIPLYGNRTDEDIAKLRTMG